MRLRLMTYNIHRAIGIDRRFRPDRIVEVVAYHQPDVVLLQEVDDGAPRSGHLDLARELAGWLSFPYLAVGHNVTLRCGRYGNATLSRFPITRERNIDLTLPQRKRRGCQHTTIQIERPAGGPPLQLEIFNLHLGLSARERGSQLGLLACSAEFAGLAPDAPCLVGGDFNDWRSLLHPMLTDGLGFRSATERRRLTTGAIRTYPSFSPTGGLDRVYYRGRMRLIAARSCRLRLARLASDHLPIIAEFALLAPPRPATEPPAPGSRPD